MAVMSTTRLAAGLPTASVWKVWMVSHMRCRTRATSAAMARRDASALTCENRNNHHTHRLMCRTLIHIKE